MRTETSQPGSRRPSGQRLLSLTAMAQHNQTGKWGENIAADYLTAKGYAIVDRNARQGGVEVDIIATRGQTIAFVEVKTRTSPLTDPLEAVGPQKVRRLARFADTYMRTSGLPYRPQIDLISIVGSEHDYEVTHIEDAFEPPIRTY